MGKPKRQERDAAKEYRIREKKLSKLLTDENALEYIIAKHPELAHEVGAYDKQKTENKKVREHTYLKTKQQRYEERDSRENERRQKKYHHRKEWFANHRKTKSGQVNFNAVMNRLWGKLEGEAENKK